MPNFSDVTDQQVQRKVEATLARADADLAARRTAEAMSGYRQVLDVLPRHVHALHFMGLACVHANDIDGARTYVDQALQAAPERADLWEHAGLLAALQRDLPRAHTCYLHALGITGSTASLHRNLADSLRLAGKLEAALFHYSRALDIEPGLHHALRAAAQISGEMEYVDHAAGYWLRAWALNGSFLQDGLDLIVALKKARRTDELAAVITEIRTRFSDNAEALKSLCYVLNTHDLVDDALSVARQGLAIAPHHALLHHNAARALSIQGRVAESRPHSAEAARLLPDNPYLQFHLAGVQLGLGEFAEGWKRYPWFYAIPGNERQLVRPPFPPWRGEPVAGCQFLMVGEQGRGDEIQFIRFAEWLHQQGASVDVLVSEPVARLAASMRCVRNVYTRIPPGPYDYWSHMLRMPEYMRLDLAALPLATAYLAPDAGQVRRWGAYLGAMPDTPAATPSNSTKRRVGVVWAGSPHHVMDRFRSIALDTLKPLFALPDLIWYSLQKGEREHESEALSAVFSIHTVGPAISDFTDTLAILATLDLLITVDTSVAHLAGAANLPVWTLIPACADWRWLTERTDSPWYPSMRLFRQRELGNWQPVIGQIRSELQRLFC
ncbi:tetratricopeptide repeat-containing glycosyltransferase family protein [Paraburkholderia sp. DHOC27]|uniref:tetratricopeptide repeat-containing glycosyltransferase family protein n=1 Tax=Paraburkholderia sp. DHOC27 TaxID=2303330 RepID=UPI000E3E3310|nr:tetratricopeptide repeat-containing glycosyltransferase family protein [Paraburkholderia sp. DHOC27]RFU48903.1 hypothetical protein D0B32_03465 [Paraburkholderia sp. DHOC27]